MKNTIALLCSILLIAVMAGCNAKPAERNQMGGVEKAPAEVEQPAVEDEEGTDDADDSEENDSDSK